MKKNNSEPEVCSDSQLFEAEEKYRLLVDSIKDYGIFQIDTHGFIQSWNLGAEKINGYLAEEIVGRHFSIFYTAEDLQKDHPKFELEHALKNEHYEEEGWRLRKDGSRFWASIVITPIRNKLGKHIGFSKVARDLSEKKEIEEKLRLSEELSRKMFESVKDYAMIMLSPSGTITSWNEGAKRIKGYEASEVIGKYFSIFYSKEDIAMGKCEYELREAIETGRFQDEGWRLRKDGTKFWGNVLITTLLDSNKNLIGFSKVTRDMTDRKRADDLLKMANSSLEKRVSERTKELNELNTQLEEAVKIRDEFMSIASHELRTPLTPLKMQIQGLMNILNKKHFEKLTDERISRMTEVCDKSLSRLNKLLDNLLDVSRINLGKFKLNYESFDLVEITENVIERHKHEIFSSGSMLTFDQEGPVVGSFDLLRTEQILSNLLMNALKFGMGRGIIVSVTQNKENALIIFKDNGVGIPESEQGRIFKRFERVESSSNVGGLGLGLYIINQIVEAHGGKISVSSSLDHGSRFEVYLPLTQRIEDE